MLGHQRIQRALLAGFLLTPGFVQLFCGYVETYALLVPGVLLYILSGYKFFRGELPLWAVAVLLGLLVPLHFTLVTLAPSLLILAVLSERNPASWSTVKKTITLGLAPALSLAILLALEIDPLEYMDNLRGSHFLPLWGSLDPIELYHHLLDFLNQQFLVAPGAIMVGALLHKRMFPPHPERIFLLSAALFPLLFTFLANPPRSAPSRTGTCWPFLPCL